MASRGYGKPGPKLTKSATASQLQAAAPALRIKNAKQLRKAYVEIQASPDGADPDPLTVPKCVECGHCGWPVYPRDSKVATKKTFARAGIERKSKREEEADKKEEEEKRKRAILAGEVPPPEEEGEKDDDAASHDSRDTVERMADELEDLKDKNEELQKRNDELEEENKDLQQKLQETEEQLEQAEEKIELLEEQDVRWREKLSAKRVEIEKLKLTLERASTVSADREGGLIKTLLELRDLREKFAAYRRRRDFMLDGYEDKLRVLEGERQEATVMHFWRARTVRDRLLRQLEDTERRRRQEVTELSDQVGLERERVSDLKATKTRLELRLKAAAHRLLRRALGAEAKPGMTAHAFHCWVGSHPASCAENALEYTQKRLEEVEAELAEWPQKVEDMQAELEQTTGERDSLAEENAQLKTELDFIRKDAGLSKESIEARMAEEKERERLHKLAVEELEEKLRSAYTQFDEEREELETQIGVLESRLAVAEAAAAAGSGANAGLEDDDPSRICPKGQGTLCMGCLKQLVHRAVKPLPPVDSLKDSAKALADAKKQFFEQELNGMPSPDDPIHGAVFAAKRDPYGLARLTMYPMSAIRKPKPGLNASAPDLTSPTTGLPALKRQVRSGEVGSLKRSMREFRPRNFR